MVDLDTMLREALAADAERAPELPDDWSGPAITLSTSTRRPPVGRRWLGGAISVGAVAAAAIGVLVVDDGDDPPGAVDTAAADAWMPGGVEFPLEDLGVPLSNRSLWVSVAGLTRALGVEGHPPLVIATTLDYAGGPTAEAQRCLWQGGSGGCAPEWIADGFDIGITSSVDNGVADYDLWTWSNVPADAAYVTYVDPPEVRWQRPIGGVALFPDVAGDDEVAVAYSGDGVELARVDRASLGAASRRRDDGTPELADISQAQFTELSELTDSTLRDCLIDHGARLDDSDYVAVLPAGVDDVEVWNRCVATVKAAVTQRLEEMNATFYDPATERPTASDPPFVLLDEPVAADELN